MRVAAGEHPRVPSIGCQRRVHALIAVGWTRAEIAARLGCTPTNLDAHLRRPTVLASTAQRIAAVYDELATSDGASRMARGQARRKHFAPPDAWDDATIDDPAATPYSWTDLSASDWVAVERAMKGEPVTLTHAERVEAVRRLTARGLGVGQVAERLRMSGARVKQLSHGAA